MRTDRDKASGKIPFGNFDPKYVQIGKRQACAILGMPSTSFDRARKEDPDFPAAIRQGNSQNAPLRFILAEVYAYSAKLIEAARVQDGAV
ncbi:hypothetical protein [Halotalea alkalilenta]|uniref:DNA-binding protein n=1 Tax=Halotalea alkalilenta TaxID=376489 RepID=A0A172YCU3_9GAMM|nr:hypothetical protein [Halotalea alkalilenta]ANF56815.1 hypothetical protein A5892_04485 [Halotalea alkalilenta]